VVRFNDVYASGYNSAGSEQIWTKFGVLPNLLSGAALTDFGHDLRRSESGNSSRNFVFFCLVSSARFHRLPVDPVS